MMSSISKETLSPSDKTFRILRSGKRCAGCRRDVLPWVEDRTPSWSAPSTCYMGFNTRICKLSRPEEASKMKSQDQFRIIGEAIEPLAAAAGVLPRKRLKLLLQASKLFSASLPPSTPAKLMVDSSGERAHAYLACVSDPPESELPDCGQLLRAWLRSAALPVMRSSRTTYQSSKAK